MGYGIWDMGVLSNGEGHMPKSHALSMVRHRHRSLRQVFALP